MTGDDKRGEGPTGRRPGARSATIKDVAERAGVSIGTVSRVLNNTTRVNAQKAERVREAVAELNYVPNMAAQNMRRKTTRMVACILTDIGNPLYARLIAAVQRKLNDSDYSMVAMSTGNVESRELAALATARRYRFDGIVYITGSQDRAEVNAAIAEVGIPTVQIEREKPDNDTFCVDHRQGVRLAAEHLRAAGHSRIGVVTPGIGARPAAARVDGFLALCAELGVTDGADLVRQVQGPVDSGFNAAMALMRLASPPTAVISLGSQLLAEVLQYMAAAGLAVPEDLSIVSIGDNELTRFGNPPISAIDWDFARVGSDAAGRLLQRIDARRGGGPDDGPTIARLYETRLIERRSVAAPKAPGRLHRG